MGPGPEPSPQLFGGNVMWYIGADLHKEQVTFVVMDRHGDILLKRRVPCKCSHRVREFFADIKTPFQLAVEAVGFYHWFYDLAQPYAEKIFLANAAEVRHRSVCQPKTDYRDATRLAELLRLGLFEKDHHLRAYVPSLDLRSLRHQTRRRNKLMRQLVNLKNAFRKFILQCNLGGPEKLNSITAGRWMKTYEDKLPDYLADTLWEIVDTMAILERQQVSRERRIAKQVTELEAWERIYQILTSLPGVGDITAWTLIAEIGDFTRFDHPEEIVNYVGLDPRVFQSADTVRHGRITKAGPRDARWILQQAAWVACDKDPRCRAIFQRIRKRAGNKKAAVAVARKLLVWAYFMIKHDQTYQAHRHDGSR